MPLQEYIDELFASCRYATEEDVTYLHEFKAEWGVSDIIAARDPHGNTCLHMAAANGHAEIVKWLFEFLPEEALYATNDAGSTPLHWAAMNFHQECLELLCPRLPDAAFAIKNAKGLTAYDTALELCESYHVGVSAMEEEEKTQELTPRGKERLRREKIVAYLAKASHIDDEEEEVGAVEGAASTPNESSSTTDESQIANKLAAASLEK